MRLRLMLMRDEQVRPRPAITLPHLNAGHPTDPQIYEPPVNSPRREPATITTAPEIVAKHFDALVSSLVGHRYRGGSRHARVGRGVGR